MHLTVKNYFINSALPTCLPWLWYMSDAQASLNVPACQSAPGCGECTSLEDGWRGCGADESGKARPASLSSSLCTASVTTCFRLNLCTPMASLHMDSFKSHLIILINKDPQHPEASQLGQLVSLLCIENGIFQMPIFSLIKMWECCTWVFHGEKLMML